MRFGGDADRSAEERLAIWMRSQIGRVFKYPTEVLRGLPEALAPEPNDCLRPGPLRRRRALRATAPSVRAGPSSAQSGASHTALIRVTSHRRSANRSAGPSTRQTRCKSRQASSQPSRGLELGQPEIARSILRGLYQPPDQPDRVALAKFRKDDAAGERLTDR